MTTIAAPPLVRRANAADAPALAHALALAFDDDPVTAWLMPRPAGRIGRLERAFREVNVRRFALPHGHAQIAIGGAGAALWIPPDKVHVSRVQMLRMLPAIAWHHGRAFPRLMQFVSALDAVHPHAPHYYLPQFGVVPEMQGRGIGSALLTAVLDRADDEGMPAYLEGTTERSRALYERHGFECVGVVQLPDDGPPLWQMWREPGAS
jgi:GNAT superfamily N-acetyltransferase